MKDEVKTSKKVDSSHQIHFSKSNNTLVDTRYITYRFAESHTIVAATHYAGGFGVLVIGGWLINLGLHLATMTREGGSSGVAIVTHPIHNNNS